MARLLPLLLLLALPQLSHAASFAELRRELYAKPLGAKLPEHPGLVTWDVISNLFGSEHKPGHGLGIRSRRTLVDESDTRPPEPKWLHPRGACAEARWIITEESGATGMFERGVSVPAIVRVSTGDAQSAYPTEGRIFGMAIKIFPDTDPNRRVKTANILTLDQDGFERTKRKFVFSGDRRTDKIYFTNVAPARSALGKFLSTFFDRFDQPNFARPLYATAAARLGGGDLLERRTPYEIRFVPDDGIHVPAKAHSDFRHELQEKGKRTLRIVLQSWNGKQQLALPIGRLELGDFVVSDFCDLDLHFHHSPIEDQWAKYLDYGVVDDLAPR